MQPQQCPDSPAVVRNTRCHRRRRGATGVGETRGRWVAGLDRPAPRQPAWQVSVRRALGASTTPNAHGKRVRTSSARAIPTMPPWTWTRLSSAYTCPRARGGATRGSCTVRPWMPTRLPPTRYRPRVKAGRDDDGLQGTM